MEALVKQFRDKMAQEDLPELVINTFEYYYRQLTSGTSGLILEKDIEPLREPDMLTKNDYAENESAGREALKHTAVIKLNGGLGTTMGLDGPKCLINAVGEYNFLDMIQMHLSKLGETYGCSVPLVLMNSFNTHEKTVSYLNAKSIPSLSQPISFIQHKFPKVLEDGFGPAKHPENSRLEWNPPGHGNIYTALVTSGVLQRLLDDGIQYAFVSNIDNLGASLDLSLLGCFASRNISFMMESVERTEMDRKGGHLARAKSGNLVLREIAQTAENERDIFQDITCHCYFNTNNIWLNLVHLKNALDKAGGVLDLPLITNKKHLDPRNPSSPEVYQIETAMGAAISIFNDAQAILVPRIRFSPVKRCEELLLAWSDYYTLSSDFTIDLNPARKSPAINIQLDAEVYRTCDRLAERIRPGSLSLVDCNSLVVEGDVRFGNNITVRGDARIINHGSKQGQVKDNTVIEGEIEVL